MTVSLIEDNIKLTFFNIFNRGSREWTLFISLPCAFFKYVNIPSAVNPHDIIFISPVRGLLSLTSGVLSWSSFRWYLWGSVFLTYFYNFPCWIKVSTWSFRCLHSSVWCSWSWWNLQYLFLSLLSTGVLIGFSHCWVGSSLICIRICLIGIIREVKLVNLGFLYVSSFFFPVAYPTLRNSFFLSWVLLVPSSLFLFPFISYSSYLACGHRANFIITSRWNCYRSYYPRFRSYYFSKVCLRNLGDIRLKGPWGHATKSGGH